MAIQVNGTTVIDNSRNLTNIASVDATTAAAIGAAGVGGGTTLLATTTLSGAREISVSGLSLSDYDLLYFFGYDIRGGDYYDHLHIRDSSLSTSERNRVANVSGNISTHRGQFGAIIDLNTGYGMSGSRVIRTDNVEMGGYQLGRGIETGVTRSTTSLVYGHSEGNGGNWTAGTVKIYGA